MLFLSAVAFICVGFFVGYFYQRHELIKKDLFISNTVGNNLSEMNRLYSLLIEQNRDYKNEQIKYNLDMLTIIDCGVFIKSVSIPEKNREAQYFVKGLDDALKTLDSNGIDLKKLVLCDARVLDLVDKK